MRPIIGKSAVVPHFIKRVRSIEAVVAIVGGIVRHLLVLFGSLEGEELLSRFVDDAPNSGRKGESR